MIIYKSFSLITLLLIGSLTFGQRRNKSPKSSTSTPKSEVIYNNHTYISTIKTVVCHPIDDESTFPIYTLGSSEYLQISFDDLRADTRAFYYSIEHCNADWNPTRANSLDYVQGFNEARVENIQNSQNTYLPYTHYSFIFPHENVSPKLAGNYILKVYEDGDPSKLILTRKLYIVNPTINVGINILNSSIAESKISNQKLNLILTSDTELINPVANLQVHVFQNQRYDNMSIVRQPSKIEPKKIIYDQPQTLDFEGNNEFIILDLRSSRSASAQIRNYEKKGDTLRATLYTDSPRVDQLYEFISDNNGKFYIRNSDFDNAAIQSEYICVNFSLKLQPNTQDKVYLVGAFNDFSLSEENRLTYDEKESLYNISKLLKQGIYNYDYISVVNNKISTSSISGSHNSTENEYLVLVYYRNPNTGWDEIIGLGKRNTNN